MKKIIISGLLFITLFSALTSQAQPSPADSAWKIKKTEWTESDEKEYSEFVARIGSAVEKRECNSFKQNQRCRDRLVT